MKNWIKYKEMLHNFLLNSETTMHILKTQKDEGIDDFEYFSEQLVKHAETFRNGEFTHNKVDFSEVVTNAELEILDWITTDNKRNLTIKTIQKEWNGLIKRLDQIVKAINMKKPEWATWFITEYQHRIGIIYTFYNWFNEKLDIEETHIPDQLLFEDIDLSTQKEQIRFLYDLGIIEYLIGKYPARLEGNNNQVAVLLAKILKLERSSIQPSINALINDNSKDKNYPKSSSKIELIIKSLENE